MPLQERGRFDALLTDNSSAGLARAASEKRKAYTLLHTWHEKLLKADIACRASAGAVPLAERDSICADGTSRASMRHEHVGCTVVMRYQWQSPAL